MAEIIELKAQTRQRGGKGAVRAVRRMGRVPAVIYGGGEDPETISLEMGDVVKQAETGAFLATLYKIDVDGKKTRVIPRDLQLDPVRDYPLHVDFLRLARDAKIDVEVAVHFINEEECPGIKRGGALNIVRHTVELTCPADAIPEFIEVDLTGLDIGDAVHISAIELPEGVTLTITDRDFTVVTVAASAAAREEAQEAQAEAEAAAAIEMEEEEEGEEGEEGGEAEEE